MTLKEFYTTIGSSYENAVSRLFKDELIKKYLLLFLKDTSFDELCQAMIVKDYETAFRSAHTLKGVCMNLELGALCKSASDITEALSGNVNNGADELLPQVTDDYVKTINAIKQLED